MLHTLILLVPLKTTITPEFAGRVGVGVTDGEETEDVTDEEEGKVDEGVDEEVEDEVEGEASEGVDEYVDEKSEFVDDEGTAGSTVRNMITKRFHVNND